MNDEDLAAQLGFNSVDKMLAGCAGKHGIIWVDVEGGQWIAYEHSSAGRKWEWHADAAHEPYEDRP